MEMSKLSFPGQLQNGMGENNQPGKERRESRVKTVLSCVATERCVTDLRREHQEAWEARVQE